MWAPMLGCCVGACMSRYLGLAGDIFASLVRVCLCFSCFLCAVLVCALLRVFVCFGACIQRCVSLRVHECVSPRLALLASLLIWVV